MNRDFDDIARRLFERATWVLENPKERWHSKNSWKDTPGNPIEAAQSAPYVPTGHAMFDKVVEKLNPHFMYGGDPMTGVQERWHQMRAIASLVGMKVMPDDPDMIRIVLPKREDFESDDGYTSTVAHELYHWWALHVPQIPVSHGLTNPAKQPSQENGVDPFYIMEECCAELFSAMLMSATGVDPNIDERAEYMAGYLNAVPSKIHKEAFERVTQVAKLAIEGVLERAEV